MPKTNRIKLPFTPFTAPEHQDFFLEGGKGAALLVHGYPGTPMEMRPLAEALHSRGWSCRGLLLPGFGAEIETLPGKTWSDWEKAVLEALTNLNRTNAPIMLVGHSLGGALAVCAAAKAPVDGMVLLAPLWRNRGLIWFLLPVLKNLIPRVKPFKWVRTEIDDPRLRREVQDFLPEMDLEDPKNRTMIRELVLPTAMFDELRKLGSTCHHSAPRVSCPTLLVQGADDTTIHPADTRRLATLLAGPAQLLEVSGEHELPFEQAACFAQVCKAVVDFAEDLLVKFEQRRTP